MNSISSWNTWDIRCLNAVMKIPEMAELRVALYDTETHYCQEEFLWANVERFGYHHPYGEYFDIDLRYEDVSFEMEFASEGDRFVYKIKLKNPKPTTRIFIASLFRWGASGSISRNGMTLSIETKGQSYRFDVWGSEDREEMLNTNHQGILLYGEEPVYVSCNSDQNIEQMNAFLAKKRAECIRSYAQGGGLLKDTPQAIIKGIMWNTVYEPIGKRLCTPVSRAWCTGNGTGFGSYVLFEWDTFFAGLLSGIQDKGYAYQQVRSILQEMTEDGMIPNFGAQNACSVDRSQPPVGAYCVLKLYRQFGEISLLKDTFDKLLTWNSWWMRNRDGNGDGLLEWGSNPYPEGRKVRYEADNHQAAMYESGLDNSPMYDGVEFNKETHTMEYADVGLNALYAMDCRALGEIARILGKHEQASVLEQEYERMKNAVNHNLWDEETGIYLNLHWDGRRNKRLSPTNFYPLIAGIASREQAERMIREHLLNENEFWGRFVIPSISRSDPAFGDNDYWRGRIWGPMNFLVGEGVKQYGFHEAAWQFAQKSQELFQQEWQEENHIHENYNADTGDGDDVKNADPVYTWGGLLGYLAISELVEAQPFEGLRFGNLSGERSSVRNVPIGNSRVDVLMDEGLTMLCDGTVLVHSDMPVMIKGLQYRGDMLKLEIISEKPGKVQLHPELVKLHPGFGGFDSGAETGSEYEDGEGGVEKVRTDLQTKEVEYSIAVVTGSETQIYDTNESIVISLKGKG